MELISKATDNGYIFLHDEVEIAIGEYERGGFQLIFKDEIKTFVNGMQAYAYIRQSFGETKYDTAYKRLSCA